MLKGRV